ncbi:MAG: hydroxymethylbilane synthase, partial [Chromatiaceae bacterium]|nr:hydroxymethylbilane synthase [Chromatiaceae bacterium]
AAGLIRLGFESRVRSSIDPADSLPAIGQGAIGIECRVEDERVHQLIAPLAHRDTSDRVLAERAMNARLNGGCQVPIGGHAVLEGDQLHLKGLVGTTDGKRILRAEASGPREQAEAIGVRVAEDLLAQGADAILSALLGH